MEKEKLFGDLIKKTRKEKSFSQKVLSEGICSQPMLSAIEQGKHIPNGQLLLQLCQRLELDVNHLSLSSHYAISKNEQLNLKMQRLCDAHEYEALKELLLASKTIESLETALDYRSYYYYLGCSTFHVDKTQGESERSFKLALAEIKTTQPLDSLTRLIYASLGLLYALKNQTKKSDESFSVSFLNLETEPFQENNGIIFYLKALAEFKLNKETTLVKETILKGIKYITAQHSVYMLANLFYLLALIDNESGNEPNQAEIRSQIFEELYGEKIYKKISES